MWWNWCEKICCIQVTQSHSCLIAVVGFCMSMNQTIIWVMAMAYNEYCFTFGRTIEYVYTAILIHSHYMISQGAFQTPGFQNSKLDFCQLTLEITKKHLCMPELIWFDGWFECISATSTLRKTPQWITLLQDTQLLTTHYNWPAFCTSTTPDNWTIQKHRRPLHLLALVQAYGCLPGNKTGGWL